MRSLPTLTYSGLTAILDRRGRHDKNDLISGLSGAYFDSSLAAGGYSSIHRGTIEVRTLDDFNQPFLNGTKTLLLLGERTLPYYLKDVSLDEQRGAPFTNRQSLTCIATYAPQDADDRRDYFSGEDDEDEKDDSETAEGKTTHGKTQRKNWRFWMRQDIKKAARITATGGVNIPQPNYHFWPEIDKVVHLLTTTKGTDFYFDIETDKNLQMTCFGFSFYEQSTTQIKVPDIYVVPMLQTYLNRSNTIMATPIALLQRWLLHFVIILLSFITVLLICLCWLTDMASQLLGLCSTQCLHIIDVILRSKKV